MKRLGLSVRVAAVILGVNASTINRYQNNEIAVPISTRLHLAAVERLTPEQREEVLRLGWALAQKHMRENQRVG